MSPLVTLIPGLIKPVLDYFDKKNPTQEETAKAQSALLLAQGQIITSALEHETRLSEARSRVIEAEAKGESWLQRSWRPILMLTFGGLVVARWLGLTGAIPLEVELKLWDIMELGLGGYVIGRSAEKIVPGVVTALKASK